MMEVLNTGLQDVIVADTRICKIDPDLGDVFYRRHSLVDLLRTQNFLQVCYLLWHGQLPTPEEYNEFCKYHFSYRLLSPNTLNLIAQTSRFTTANDCVRTALSSLQMECEQRTSGDNKLQALFYLAQIRSIISAVFRAQNGLSPKDNDIEDDNLSFLNSCFEKKVGERTAQLFNKVRILYAEHELNAASYTARVVASTGADIGAVINAAFSSLSGPLHGGAVEHVQQHYKSVKKTSDVERYLEGLLARRQRVMGFGHRVYMKTGDPRYQHMLEVLADMPGQKKENSPYQICTELQRVMFYKKSLVPNLDLAGAACFHALGFKKDLFLSLIAMSRLAGWCAHYFEQVESGRIIRPRARFIHDS